MFMRLNRHLKRFNDCEAFRMFWQSALVISYSFSNVFLDGVLTIKRLFGGVKIDEPLPHVNHHQTPVAWHLWFYGHERQIMRKKVNATQTVILLTGWLVDKRVKIGAKWVNIRPIRPLHISRIDHAKIKVYDLILKWLISYKKEYYFVNTKIAKFKPEPEEFWTRASNQL